MTSGGEGEIAVKHGTAGSPDPAYDPEPACLVSASPPKTGLANLEGAWHHFRLYLATIQCMSVYIIYCLHCTPLRAVALSEPY